MAKTLLLGKTYQELKIIVSKFNMPSFTAKQIAEWIYKKNVDSIDEMTNISLKNRELLAKTFEVGKSKPIKQQVSTDGTIKYLFQTKKKHHIESVFIPEDNRATLCISSQVGCKMNCLFCMTGKQGFDAQLSTNEILNQLYSLPENEKITNIVFMGMGEPLDNLDNVLKSLEIMTADYGMAWSPKRITVSTIGILPKMKIFLEQSNCHLAISMHTPFTDERLDLIPIEKAYPIKKILEELKNYDFRKQRRLSFEYIMFDGLNDTMRHSREIVRLLKDLPCRVNLIRYHAIPGINLKSSNEKRMFTFRDYLTQNGIMTTIRKSRGEDIFAACGMLSSSEHS